MPKKASAKTKDDAPAVDKEKLLNGVLKTIEKQYGQGSIMKLGERPKVDVEPIPTGSLLLDQALGIGGYPKGRIIEIYGPESSGKTTLALHAIAELQKKGGRAAFIDAENAIDPVYARNLGVDIDELILSQPDYGEQALNIVLMLVESGAVDLIIVDSVAALVPKQEIDGEMGDMQVGAQARMMSKALRKLAKAMNNNDCTVIFINQLRNKIGVMYGSPETTPGGLALKFYASIRIDIRFKEPIKDGPDIIGNKVRVKVVKNKVAPPFKKVLLDILFGKGISADGELLELAVQFDIVKKSGSWYSYNGDRLGQGKEKSLAFLLNNPEIKKEIEDKVINTIRQGTEIVVEGEPISTVGSASSVQAETAGQDDELDEEDLLDGIDLLPDADDLLDSNEPLDDEF